MRYFISKEDRNMDMLDISNIKYKIDIIKDNNNESCKYINNIYESYIKLLNKEERILNNISNELDNSFCSLSENILDIIKIKTQEKLVLLCFTNSINDRHSNLYKFCQDNNIKIYFVSKFNNDTAQKYNVLTFNYLSILKALKEDNPYRVFFDFDVSCINTPENWHLLTKKSYENILREFSLYSKQKIIGSPEIIAYNSITNKYNSINIKKSLYSFNIEKIIKLMVGIQRFCISNNIRLGVDDENNKVKIANIYCRDININTNNSQTILELSKLIHTLGITDKKDRLSYIYDSLCSYLEEDITLYSYCNFSENKCIAQRDPLNKTGWPKNKYNGCCFDIEGKKDCEHLLDKSCKIECISCRLFTCKYLKDRGIDYSLRKNLQVKCFISLFKSRDFVWNFFTEKEKTLK